MSLNTRIRGIQIKDADVDTLQLKDDAVTLEKLDHGSEGQIIICDILANGPAYKDVSGDITINKDGVTAIGATKVVDSMINDDVATGLAGDGLSAASGVMALDLNELTAAVVAVATDSIAIIDSDGNVSRKESIADLATAMAGTGITATAGVLSADSVTDNIVEGDIQVEDETANCNGSNVAFTLSNTPLANSLDVFLNGMRQVEGSGESFTVSGTTVTFVTAPAADDDLIIRYIIDNA